jgi:hypothetical protein
VFFIDRIEGQSTRVKVEELQTRYCEVERLYIGRNRANDPMHFTKLLLLLSKLRALDALSKRYKEFSRIFRSYFII